MNGFWSQENNSMWVSSGDNGIWPGVYVAVFRKYEGFAVLFKKGKIAKWLGNGRKVLAYYNTLEDAEKDVLRARESQQIRKGLEFK